jgi:hypothetical protein
LPTWLVVAISLLPWTKKPRNSSPSRATWVWKTIC